MKKILYALLVAFISTSAFAQDEAQIYSKDSVWSMGGFASFQTNQVALVNWAGGGENSISGTALGQVWFRMNKKGWKWFNRLDMGYGLTWTRTFGFTKNEDKIDFLSRVTRPIAKSKVFSYMFEANFKTQFAPGYALPDDSTVISRAMAPGYLLLTLGVEYQPAKWINFYLSPATGKFTFVTDQTLADAGAFGVDAAVYDETTGALVTPGGNLNAEFGAYFKMGINKTIMKNVTLTTDLNLFNNYTDKDVDNRKNIDVDWQTSINMKVNKWLTVSLFTHLIYDNDIRLAITELNGDPVYDARPDGSLYLDENGDPIQKFGPRVQFKEVLGVGLSYKF